MSISNRKVYPTSQCLIEKSIPNRKVYTKCLYLVEKSMRYVNT